MLRFVSLLVDQVQVLQIERSDISDEHMESKRRAEMLKNKLDSLLADAHQQQARLENYEQQAL
jgi:predicted RNase H-like nuclease (RuvC/YqgF family)